MYVSILVVINTFGGFSAFGITHLFCKKSQKKKEKKHGNKTHDKIYKNKETRKKEDEKKCKFF